MKVHIRRGAFQKPEIGLSWYHCQTAVFSFAMGSWPATEAHGVTLRRVSAKPELQIEFYDVPRQVKLLSDSNDLRNFSELFVLSLSLSFL